MLIIGKCVIVMSKYFWNEYKKALLNKEILNNILKFHQRTNMALNDAEIIEESHKFELTRLLECDRICVPSINIKEFKADQIKNIDLRYLLTEITEYYKQIRIVITLPIIYLNQNYGDIKAGCYTINIEDNKLIGYNYPGNYIKTLCNNNFANMVLFIFANIEDAICLYEESGYIKSIEQVGGLFYKLVHGKAIKNMKMLQYSLNNQKITHDLGINLRKELLIESIFFVDSHMRKE